MKVKVLDTLNGSFVSIDDLIQSYENESDTPNEYIERNVLIQSLRNLKPISKPTSFHQLLFQHLSRVILQKRL